MKIFIYIFFFKIKKQFVNPVLHVLLIFIIFCCKINHQSGYTCYEQKICLKYVKYLTVCNCQQNVASNREVARDLKVKINLYLQQFLGVLFRLFLICDFPFFDRKVSTSYISNFKFCISKWVYIF